MTATKAKIRKIATFVEETQREMDRVISPPTRRAAAVAVIENPYAGKYVEDLSELMAIGEELGEMLTQRAVAALGIPGLFGRKLWQGCGRWGERRIRARRRDSASQTRHARPKGAGQGGGADPIFQEARGDGSSARHPPRA